MAQAFFRGGVPIAVVVLALAGCGGGSQRPAAAASDEPATGGETAVGPTGPVHRSGSGSVSADLGPGGGSLELADGPRVEIPAGSIEGAQEYRLTMASRTTAFSNDEHQRPIGPTFSLSPGVSAPDGKLVTVSIPLASYPAGWGGVTLAYEEVASEMVGAEDSVHTTWSYATARLSGGRAVADLEALPGSRLQFVLSSLEAK